MAPPISGECEGNNPLSDIKEETEEDLEVDAFDYEICRSWRIANWYAARVWMGPTWILTIVSRL